MKLKDGYLLRNVAGVHLVVPIAERVIEFKGMMTLNETGAFLWRQLLEERNKEDLASALTDEFEVDRETAASDVDDFIEKLKEAHVLV